MAAEQHDDEDAMAPLAIDLSKEYIDSGRLREPLRRVFDEENIQYVEETRKYIPKVATIQVRAPGDSNEAFKTRTLAQRQLFRKKLELLQAKCIRDNKGIRVDLDECHEWEGVEKLLRKAVSSYERKKGAEPLIARFFSRVSKCGQAVQAWMQLLPDGEYSSVICGGFKLIINTVVKLAKVREKILDAICRIPLAMERAELLSQLYHKSERFQLTFGEFYLAVLNASLAMVEWLLDSSFWDKAKEFFKAFASQDQYGENLDKSLKRVDDCADSIRQEADIHNKQETQETKNILTLGLQNVDDGQRHLIKGQYVLGGMQEESWKRGVTYHEENMKGFRSLEDSQQRLIGISEHVTRTQLEERHISEVHWKNQTSQNQSLSAQQEQIIDAQKQFSGMQIETRNFLEYLSHGQAELANNLKDFFDQQEVESYQAKKDRESDTTERLTPKRREMIAEEVIARLDYDGSTIMKDLEIALKRGPACSVPEQERAELMLRGQALKDWLTSPDSRTLLVDGNADHLERVSPLSFASALLIQSVMAFPQASKVVFFCGQHIDMQDTDAGPQMLMASFVGQLTTQWQYFDYPYVEVKPLSAQLAPAKKLKSLCKIFGSMVQQLHAHDTLLCIVEGIKYYECSTWLRDLVEVLDMLTGLAGSKDVKACVKILIVNTTRSSTDVVNIFNKDDMLRLPYYPTPYGQGFNSRHYQLALQEDIEGRGWTTSPKKMTKKNGSHQRKAPNSDDSDEDGNNSGEENDSNNSDEDGSNSSDSGNRKDSGRNGVSPRSPGQDKRRQFSLSTNSWESDASEEWN